MSLRRFSLCKYKQLHHQLVGVAVVDFALQEDHAVFQQQVAQRHLPLALVIAHRLGRQLARQS